MNEKIKINLGMLGLLVAVVALIVSVLNWLTLNPVEPAPISSTNGELIEVAAGKQTATSGFWQYSTDYSFPPTCHR